MLVKAAATIVFSCGVPPVHVFLAETKRCPSCVTSSSVYGDSKEQQVIKLRRGRGGGLSCYWGQVSKLQLHLAQGLLFCK